MSKQIDLEKLREMAEDDVKRGRQWSTDSRDVLMLLDHIAALEKDAARWNAATRNMELNDVCVVVYDNFGDGRTVTGEEADQAIDTAMEASNAKAD